MPSSNYFPFHKAGNKASRWELLLWFAVHLSIPLLLLLSLFIVGPVRVNTLLFDMLPRSGQYRAVMEADRILSERNGREAVILAAAPSFENARAGAAILYAKFENSPEIEAISLYFDAAAIDEFNRHLFDYRFVIAGRDTLALLESGMAEEIAHDALASAFGAFVFLPLDNIENDPFLLAERRMRDFLASPLLAGAMALQDGVLASEQDGIWHVMLRMTLSPAGISLQADRNVVGQIYAATAIIKDAMPNLEFLFSGVPFHSFESASSAQREISLISTITLLIILFLFLYVFRSAVPVISSVLAIGISIGMATGTTLLFFREIHIITFVFGTTLIGIGVDYSVHFFAHWKGNPAVKNGGEIRSRIIKNITMSFVSTQICFIVFLLAPFPILRQFAVFSMAGILSSYLTFFCIYPCLKLPEKSKRQFQFSSSKIFLWMKTLSLPRYTKPIVFAGLLAASLTLIVFNASAIRIENNLSSLYTMSEFLLKSEQRVMRVLDYGFPGWYYIVSGSTLQETLENEEELVIRLEEEIARGNLESFLATSIFVPSIKNQRRTYEAMKALLPLVDAQFEFLGFPPGYAQAFKEEFAVAAVRHSLPENAPSHAGISNLWIGEHNGNYFSSVMPFRPTDISLFKSIADEFDNVHFINMAEDISRDMDTLTRTMLLLFLAAYIVVSVIIFFAYPWRDNFKICLVPLLLAIGTLAVLAANRIYIGFFSVAALVLVFGLSLDYIFFMTGKKSKTEKNLARLGVFLSFITALLSFGALALSGFMPVHLFGLTVSAGLGAAFISAIILQSKGT